jgi:predicted DNA-binding transcriptional regulator AlpA
MSSETSTVEIKYVMEITGFSAGLIRHMCHRNKIPGAFQLDPGVRGSRWRFHRGKLLNWWAELVGNK